MEMTEAKRVSRIVIEAMKAILTKAVDENRAMTEEEARDYDKLKEAYSLLVSEAYPKAFGRLNWH